MTLFLRNTLIQVAAILLALIVAGASVKSILLTLVFFFPVSLYLGKRLLAPLGRIIARSQAGEQNWDHQVNLRIEEASEWAELETAMIEMKRDLDVRSHELMREREELAALMAGILDGILAVDLSEKVLFTNVRFEQLFGVSTNLTELIRSPEVLAIFRQSFREAQAFRGEVLLHCPGDQQSRYFSFSSTPLKKESGEVYGAVGVFHDVSELKKAEKVRIDFVANVSHELRTPLTVIKGYTETLLADAANNRTQSLEPFLNVISRNVGRLNALVEDLLDLSALDGGAELEKSPMNTREVTERTLNQLSLKNPSKQLDISTNFGADTVIADPRRVEQILVNLIDNAIKYVPTGGKIQVIWEQQEGAILLRIKDNGPGIPSESLDRLFERFYRVDQARSREIGGTGLGLAIVKHIMQRHGGSVQAKSEQGQGAEFICVFPNP